MGKRPKSPFPDYDEDEPFRAWDYQPDTKYLHNLLPRYASAPVPVPVPVPIPRTRQAQTLAQHAVQGRHTQSSAYNVYMMQAQAQAQAQEDAAVRVPQPPMTIGGRRWWAVLGKLISFVATMLAIATEFLFVMRDATANITALPSNSTNDTSSGSDDSAPNDTESNSDDAGDDSSRLRRLLVRAASNATSKALSSSAAVNSTSNSTACQWVADKDVHNDSNGIPYAVSYHLFTAIILIIVLLSELHIWRRRLHPSAMFNVGIVQLWAGLAVLSRAFDLFSQIVGYVLLVAGIGNFAFGFMCRFEPGGPGFSLFQTGTAAAPEELAQKQQQALYNAQLQAQQAQMQQKGDLAAPSPYQEEKEAMKAEQRQQSPQTTAQEQATAQASEAPAAAQQTAAAPHIILPNPLAADSGYDTMPLLNQLGMTNPFIQQQVLQALATPGGVAAGANPLLDDTAPLEPPEHIFQSPYVGNGGTSSKKKWRHRMSGGRSSQ